MPRIHNTHQAFAQSKQFLGRNEAPRPHTSRTPMSAAQLEVPPSDLLLTQEQQTAERAHLCSRPAAPDPYLREARWKRTVEPANVVQPLRSSPACLRAAFLWHVPH